MTNQIFIGALLLIVGVAIGICICYAIGIKDITKWRKEVEADFSKNIFLGGITVDGK